MVRDDCVTLAVAVPPSVFGSLNRLEVIGRGFGVGSAESERRHVRVNGAQPILEPRGEVVVVELAVAQRAKGRGIGMRAPAAPAHGMTLSMEAAACWCPQASAPRRTRRWSSAARQCCGCRQPFGGPPSRRG